MQPVKLHALRDELRPLYLPPFGAVATFKKVRQVLDEVEAQADARTTADLTPTTVGRWVVANPGRSHPTARSLLSSLRRVCSYAIHRGYLQASPFDFRPLADWIRDLEPDAETPPKVRHHPIDDLRRAFAAMRTSAGEGWRPHRLYALAVATAMTGARAREVQCSRVDDWDLPGRLFAIRPNDRRRLKTRPSRRRVPLPPELAEVLARWLPLTACEWAFPGTLRRGPWQGGYPGTKPLDELKAAGLAAGVSGLTFLSLRHSYITHSEGAWRVPDLLTRRFAGHTRRETTEGYRGFDPANGRAAVESITLGLRSP